MPAKKTAVEPGNKSVVEGKLAIQSKPGRGKWGRRLIMATGASAILYLAYYYVWPLLPKQKLGITALAPQDAIAKTPPPPRKIGCLAR